jgi:hypothetical protein
MGPVDTQTASGLNPINFAKVLLSFAVGLMFAKTD